MKVSRCPPLASARLLLLYPVVCLPELFPHRRIITAAYNKEQGISSTGYTPGKPLPPPPLPPSTSHATCIRSLLAVVGEPRMQSLVHLSAFVTQNFSF